MKSSVIIFPGSNCDRDMDVALKKYGFKNHMIWHNDLKLPKSDLVVLPGGFSYGDYLRCGSIAGKSKIIKSVIDFANSGGLVLGICNGFQILTETGLLPGVLQQNKFLNFIQDDVDKLHKNALLNSLEKIKFDQKIKLSERNRRALNLLLDLKNRQITTITLLKACLFREESRGGHYRDDFPDKDKNWECHTRQQLDQKIQKRFIKN